MQPSSPCRQHANKTPFIDASSAEAQGTEGHWSKIATVNQGYYTRSVTLKQIYKSRYSHRATTTLNFSQKKKNSNSLYAYVLSRPTVLSDNNPETRITQQKQKTQYTKFLQVEILIRCQLL